MRDQIDVSYVQAAGEWDFKLQGPLDLGAIQWKDEFVCSFLTSLLRSWVEQLAGGDLPLEIPKVSDSDWERSLSRHGYWTEPVLVFQICECGAHVNLE